MLTSPLSPLILTGNGQCLLSWTYNHSQVNLWWGTPEHKRTKDRTLLKKLWNVVCTWKSDAQSPLSVETYQLQAWKRLFCVKGVQLMSPEPTKDVSLWRPAPTVTLQSWIQCQCKLNPKAPPWSTDYSLLGWTLLWPPNASCSTGVCQNGYLLPVYCSPVQWAKKTQAFSAG